MNILYLHTHDTGRFIEPYGFPVPMPNVSALADESAVFRNAFCTAPTCSPSRVGMLTGTMPNCAGMYGLAHRGFRMNDPTEHLAYFLKSHGYETVLCGVQHEGAARAMGYERVYNHRYDGGSFTETDRCNAEHAVSYLREGKTKPFFLSYGMFNTHRPFPAHGDAVNPDRLPVPPCVQDTAANRSDMADFARALTEVDENVGKVLAALRESGLYDDTLILYTTDHGIAFPNMKCTLYDGGIGVNLMLKYPGNPSAGKTLDMLVSHLDVFPTICELLGLEPKPGLQGKSLVPALEKGENIRDEIFAEVTYHVVYEPQRCIRTDRYKLIRRYSDDLVTIPCHLDGGCAAKKDLLAADWQNSVHPREELYDLLYDPSERHNRVGDAVYAEVYKELSERLDRHLAEIGDVIYRYPEGVPAPNGADISPIDN